MKERNEYNSQYISFLQEITPTEPLDYNDVATMNKRFMHYLDVCAERGMKIGNQAAYLAIGVTKEQVYDWTNNERGNPERSHFLKKVKQFCGVYREGLMADGKINPVTGIFWQKNYDGLKDQQEHIIAPVNPLGEQKSASELEKKYNEVAFIDEKEPKSAKGDESQKEGSEG